MVRLTYPLSQGTYSVPIFNEVTATRPFSTQFWAHSCCYRHLRLPHQSLEACVPGEVVPIQGLILGAVRGAGRPVGGVVIPLHNLDLVTVRHSTHSNVYTFFLSYLYTDIFLI